MSLLASEAIVVRNSHFGDGRAEKSASRLFICLWNPCSIGAPTSGSPYRCREQEAHVGEEDPCCGRVISKSERVSQVCFKAVYRAAEAANRDGAEGGLVNIRALQWRLVEHRAGVYLSRSDNDRT
jgi:hypothetical protein